MTQGPEKFIHHNTHYAKTAQGSIQSVQMMICHALANFHADYGPFYIVYLWFNKLVHDPSKMTDKIIYLLIFSFPFISLSPFLPLLFSHLFVLPIGITSSLPSSSLMKQFHHSCSSCIPLSPSLLSPTPTSCLFNLTLPLLFLTLYYRNGMPAFSHMWKEQIAIIPMLLSRAKEWAKKLTRTLTHPHVTIKSAIFPGLPLQEAHLYIPIFPVMHYFADRVGQMSLGDRTHLKPHQNA